MLHSVHTVVDTVKPIWCGPTWQHDTNKRDKNMENPPKSAGSRQSSRGSAGTCQSSRRDNKSDTERRPGPLWESATHILTAHHSGRPLAGPIINPAGGGYMVTSDASHLPSIKHTGRRFDFSTHVTHYAAASRQLKTFQRRMKRDFSPISLLKIRGS